MRKLIVGLMVVGLLAGAGPALAQAPGTADPLGLISSGGIVPYFGALGNLSFLEVASPVGDNSSLTRPFHLIFFDATCIRGDSVDLELTTNDLAVLDLGAIEPVSGSSSPSRPSTPRRRRSRPGIRCAPEPPSSLRRTARTSPRRSTSSARTAT
jgi:hypothetical protein